MVPAYAYRAHRTPRPGQVFYVKYSTRPAGFAVGDTSIGKRRRGGALDQLRIASIAAVSKYEPLRRFLADRRDGEWRATFAGVDEVLGFMLCNSARAYRPWRANDPSHAQALHGWLAAGWQTVDVDVGGEALMFVRQR